jgi:hypothetical protein
VRSTGNATIDPELLFVISTHLDNNKVINNRNRRGNISIEQLANLSEVFSGIVVAVTLIIVVFQMRQNNNQVQAEALREAINDFVRTIVSASSNEADAANLRIGLNNFSDLSPDGKACFHSKLVKMFGGFDQVYNLYLAKRLSKLHFEATQRTYFPYLMTQGGSEWFNTFKSMAPVHIVEHIEQAIADPNLYIKPLDELCPWLNETV